MKKDMKKKLDDSISFGFVGGILFGAIIFLMTLLGILFNFFPETLSLVSDWYGLIGYDVTPIGMLLGLIYGFIDGFILFFLSYLLYKRFKR